MIDMLRNTIRQAARRPGKTALQLALVAAGAMAFSAGLSLAGSLSALERETYRYRVAVASGSTDEAGRFEYTRPSLFTDQVLESLKSDTGLFENIAAVSEVRWNAVKTELGRYSIRSLLSAQAAYADIMGLSLLSGRTFSDEESSAGAKLILLSRSAAEGLFGSVEAALGAGLEAERGLIAVRRGPQDTQTRVITERYEVCGVYEDPSELARSALGIPDAVIPFGAERPPGMSARSQISVFVARTDGSSPEALKRKLAEALSVQGIEGAAIEAWEGDPMTPNAKAAAEARKTINALAGAIVSIGVLILAASVFGVYTSTAMEAADGRKSTAVRRALGESAVGTIGRFTLSNALFGSGAALAGAILSLPAYRALAHAAETVIGASGMAKGSVFPPGPPWWAPVLGVLAGAAACALFALPAAWGASRASVVEGIQEL